MAAWRLSEMGRSEAALDCLKAVFGEIVVDDTPLCGVLSIVLHSNTVILWFRKQLTTHLQVKKSAYMSSVCVCDIRIVLHSNAVILWFKKQLTTHLQVSRSSMHIRESCGV